MDIAVKWDIALSILSFILAAISVWIALSTLSQSKKMIEEATRPSLSFIMLSDSGCVEFYIKNSGASDAIVQSVVHSMNFIPKNGYYPFKDCVGAVISPDQYICYVEEYREFCETNDDIIHIRIEYKSNAGNKYVLDQDYSVIALRNQSFVEQSINDKNASIVQAKSMQRIANIQRIK